MSAHWPLYAFDNYFRTTDCGLTIAERWDLLKALGYGKGYHSTARENPSSWSEFLGLEEQRRRSGLGLAAAYTVVDLSSPEPVHRPRVIDMIHHLRTGDTLELALQFGWQVDCSDPGHDAAAEQFLRPLLESAAERGVVLSLYHHFGFWLERIEDAVRLAARIDHPNLGVTFCGYHWFACGGNRLGEKIARAAPWLRLVNLCGARPAHRFAGILPATVEPVGEGTFPLAEFIDALRAIDYCGDVGFQGFRIEGDPRETLGRSIEAFRRAAEA